MSTTLINGIRSEFIDVRDRSIHYGDGLFESILLHQGELYFWDLHYQRLRSSAGKLNMECPEQTILLEDIKNLSPGGRSQVIKLIITRGISDRGYRYKPPIKSKQVQLKKHNRIVQISALPESYSSIVNNQLFSGDICICRTPVSVNPALAGIKHLNRLENVMARSEWEDEYLDGLMLDCKQNIIEGTMTNVFAVRDSVLYTPDLSQSGVDGVMRQVIIELASKMNIQLNIEPLTIERIALMDELFVCNSLTGIRAVNSVLSAGNKIAKYNCNNMSEQLHTRMMSDKLGLQIDG